MNNNNNKRYVFSEQERRIVEETSTIFNATVAAYARAHGIEGPIQLSADKSYVEAVPQQQQGIQVVGKE